MPQIGYACEKCSHSKTRMVSPKEAGLLASREDCPACGAPKSFRRLLGKTNSVSKIQVDNGLMGKAVELIPEVIKDKYLKR
jgi:putative FmdB family regulatory protein